MLGMAAIWLASTVRSGSAMVDSTPSRKYSRTGISSLFFPLSTAPTPSPMGSMDMSTPRVKKPMPITSSTAPNRNSTRVPGSRGAMVTDSRNTMAVMGRTEAMDS